MKTIDITALEWFDKVNGNSYFAATIIVDYKLPTEQKFILPFQYGYGDHYISMAAQELNNRGLVKLEKYSSGGLSSLWRYCEENNIILRSDKHTNCKKRELKDLTV